MNGTYINGERVQTEAPLNDGDLVQFGPVFQHAPGGRDKPGLLESMQAMREFEPDLPITLEIHEAIVTGPSRIAELRAALRDLNVTLAYDDFGAGQSRLLELFAVRPEYVKFDMRGAGFHFGRPALARECAPARLLPPCRAVFSDALRRLGQEYQRHSYAERRGGAVTMRHQRPEGARAVHHRVTERRTARGTLFATKSEVPMSTRFPLPAVVRALLLSVAVPAICFAQTAAESPVDAVRKAESALRVALLKNDAEALGKLLTDDFIRTPPTTPETTKAQWLDLIRSGEQKYLTFEVKEAKYRAYGDTVIVNAVINVSVRRGTADIELNLRLLDVWVKQNGRWLLAAVQANQVPM